MKAVSYVSAVIGEVLAFAAVRVLMVCGWLDRLRVARANRRRGQR